MRVKPEDGLCRTCSGILEITDADDATMTVECDECGDTYVVEPDAFGDGAVIYWPAMMAKLEQGVTMIPRDPSNPAYVFIPDEMAEKLLALYATENQDDPIAYLKFFTPDSSWSWYLVEYSPEQRLCFGLVVGHAAAWTKPNERKQ